MNRRDLVAALTAAARSERAGLARAAQDDEAFANWANAVAARVGQQRHRRGRGWVGLLLGLLAAGGVVSQTAPETIALVNQQPIPRAAVERSSAQRYGYLFAESQVLSELLRQAAAKAGAWPTEAEVDTELKLFIATHFAHSQERYQRWLTEYARDPETLRDEIRLQLAQRQLRSRGVPSDEASLRRYFEQNKSLYQRPESLVYRQLTIPWKGTQQSNDRGPVIDPENQAVADAVLARIRGGESFEEVARQVSDDPAIVRTGGLTGPVSVDVLQGSSASAYDALSDLRPGEVVARPVFYSNRFHTLQLVERIPATSDRFEDHRQRVAADYLALQLEPQEEFLAGLLRNAQISLVDPRYSGLHLTGRWVSPSGLALPGWLRETR